jgi:hypothetical protein
MASADDASVARFLCQELANAGHVSNVALITMLGRFLDTKS